MKTRPTMLVMPLKKIIRDPKTRAILSHEEPTEVPANSHWNRCVMFGDVERVGQKKKNQLKKTAALASVRVDKE